MSELPFHEPEAREASGLPASLARVIDGRPRELAGLPITRILPERRRRSVGPFVFLDHMGPAELAPGRGFDVLPHPHLGLSTVTYLFDGVITHRDSLGNVQRIEPGALNLMRAGRGIVHSERAPAEVRERGGRMHGLQLWLALPLADEDSEPAFAHHPVESLPSWEQDGARLRLLLGEAWGRRSPAADPSRPFYMDVSLPAGASVEVPREVPECAVYLVDGELQVGDARFHRLQLLVRAPGAALRLQAMTDARAVILGGPPLDAPRFTEWNFVASSRDRIERAKAAWRAQSFPKIPGDDREFVPLPP